MRKNIILIVITTISFFAGASIMYFVAHNYPIGKTTEIVNKVEIRESSINKSVEKVFDASVMVEVYKGKSLIGIGSGFVYKEDDSKGYILTNYHVIEDGTNVRIVFSDNTIVIADVLGKSEIADIAVLSVSKDRVLKVATIGNSDNMKIGDIVFTVGSPTGIEFRGSISKGIVSARNRFLNVGEVPNDYLMKVIQTDAAVNPGNSGGPLVNVNGEVIGITSLKLGIDEKIEGVGFAIPINDVLGYVKKLEKGEALNFPTVDFTYVSLTDSDTLNKLGITNNTSLTSGVIVTSGLKNNAFKKGDVIIAIDNVEINNADYFEYYLSHHNIGDSVALRYNDGKSILTKNVILVSK